MRFFFFFRDQYELPISFCYIGIQEEIRSGTTPCTEGWTHFLTAYLGTSETKKTVPIYAYSFYATLKYSKQLWYTGTNLFLRRDLVDGLHWRFHSILYIPGNQLLKVTLIFDF